MGLAASQARFLGLTARKSNIEYEGQQVNQQRTALAQEVNSLYSKLLALEVPIAPDTTEFYESNYSFSIADTTNGAHGDYRIKSYFENDDGTYYINAERTYDKNVAEQTNLANQWKVVQNENGEYTLVSIKDSTQTKELKLATDPSAMINLINSTNGLTPVDENDGLYYYKDDDGQSHFIPALQVTGYNENSTENTLNSYFKTNKTDTVPVQYDNVTLGFDGNGRVNSITIPDVATSLEVDTTRYHDDAGFDAALRDYTMSKDEYDKMVADLNAQTESLQHEDKILELRLNQIDTEQNELKTELEAVKSILKDNIDKTFKTFTG